jgi:hypothetical protein
MELTLVLLIDRFYTVARLPSLFIALLAKTSRTYYRRPHNVYYSSHTQ